MVTRNTISAVIQSGVPALIMGSPGVGKTSWIQMLGRQLDLPVECLVGSRIDPTDIGGTLWPDQDKARYVLPDWFVRLEAAGKGLLFFDELTTAPMSVQACFLKLVAEREIHGRKLPSDVLVVGAANPPDEAAGGWDLAASMANRWCHLEWTLDTDAWIQGTLSGWQDEPVRRLPEGWRQGIGAARNLIAGYVRKVPAALLDLPKDEAARSQPWASPRTWDLAAQAKAALDSVGEAPDEAIAGLVGKGHAIAFLKWLKALDLPDVEAWLAAPTLITLPKADDALFVTCGALSQAVLKNVTLARWQAAWVCLEAVAQRAPDVGAIAAKQLAKARPKGAKAPKGVQAYLPLLMAMGDA